MQYKNLTIHISQTDNYCQLTEIKCVASPGQQSAIKLRVRAFENWVVDLYLCENYSLSVRKV